MSHQNPTGPWTHNGPYVVVLTKDATTEHLPPTVTVRGKTVYVFRGHIEQFPGGIQFHAGEVAFSWGYKFIREIRSDQDTLIWQNNDYCQKK